MEKGSRGMSCRGAICGIVALLSATAFSCSLAAEFHKVKVREGHEARRQPLLAAQELRVRAGRVSAIAFLFVAQLVGTTASVTTAYAGGKPKKIAAAARGRIAFIALLSLSWYAELRGSRDPAGDRGEHEQRARYGRGWMDGDCYVARNGVFGGAAALVVVTALITLGLTFATEPTAAAMASTCAAGSDTCSSRTYLEAAEADAEQPAGRSKQ
ncbi:hypothetical protein HU200_011050 [Digitaria exilis]|uniref:Uncharacterized protein n=1 Tax=Digitaria exilis TaxID=1010633 RepID=A0A835KN22_9POAL|nr:hypothetical protein HU200_011050 [Digitaria exilis]